MDQIVVRVEAGPVAAVQEPEDEEQPLGGHDPVDLLSGDRAAQQEGRLLLQAVPSDGAVNLGTPWTRQGVNGSGRAAAAHRLPDIQGTQSSGRQVLDGRP